jgi:serine/threonine protein kinase
MEACPDESAFQQLVEGRLPATGASSLWRHADACRACRRLLAHLARATPTPADAAAAPADPDDPLAPGAVIDGRYRIEQRLGAGGSSVVYAAHDLAGDRRVAIKLLAPPAVEGEPGSSRSLRAELSARFRREARALERLRHPAIIEVFGAGETEGGQLYLAIELVDGVPLDRVLAREGPLPVARALPLLAQLADALAHAHAAGVVHRDLKPANLMSIAAGSAERLKVVDFGLGKIVDGAPRPSGIVSREGELFGTPPYMAPEQWNGERSDPRIDLYAFGCIALELVTGAPPFSGRPMQLMAAHLNTPPPRLVNRKPGAPAALDRMIGRCLEKDPARRPGAARELHDLLRAT